MLPNIKSDIQHAFNVHPGYRLLVTGHSLGGAIAALASTILADENPSRIVSLYTFGEPRVGDYGYAQTHDRLVSDSWRVVHLVDIVPHLPSCAKNTADCLSMIDGATVPACMQNGPYHHGTEVGTFSLTKLSCVLGMLYSVL